MKIKDMSREEYKRYKREWARRNYKSNPTKHREAVMKSFYGINLAQYDRMYNSQRGLCAICGKPESSRSKGRTKSLAIDHNHTTGEVRALLCYKCNTMIGFATESPTILRNAALYLEIHSLEFLSMVD